MAELALGLDLAAFVVAALGPRRGTPGEEWVRTRRYGLTRILLACAAAAVLALLIYRSLRIGYPALTGTYEGLLALVCALNGFLAAGADRMLGKNRLLLAGGALAALVLMAALSSPLVSDALYPPAPILRSGWLVLHVAFAFVGLALFTVAAVAGVVGLVSGRAPSSARDRSAAMGLAFYAVGGLVFGAIWAEAAWGRFWGWDPKETWALITTLVYSAYLHLRFVRKVSDRAASILVILAWLVAAFAFVGVNTLLSGLHSYG
jgi:ABC-type transport system involved in cytochrome c biogenesis permease subunit